MANAIPVRVPGTGGPTLEYVLPANMMQFVQSVNAVIDNTAGADATPVLTVLDSSSEVIADVEQGRSIPAGDSGRATWALGLRKEGGEGIREVESLDGSIVVTSPFGPVVDLSAHGGDYIFVQELPFGTSGDFTFAVPQDARHLVIFLDFTFAAAVPIIQLNGDTAAHYRTFSQITQDFNGVTSDVLSGATPDNKGVYLLGMDQLQNRAVITIPYYRQTGSAGFFQNPRALEVEAWTGDDGSFSGNVLLRHVKLAGWWFQGAGHQDAVTSIKFITNGGAAKASLYKIR